MSTKRTCFIYAGYVVAFFSGASWLCYGHLDFSSYRVSYPPFSPGRSSPISLPPGYVSRPEDSLESEFCLAGFGTRYLLGLARRSMQYCSSGSPSSLTCFHTQNHPEGYVDSLCIGQHAALDRGTGQFRLGCQVRTPRPNETAAGLIGLSELRSYWYNTGPGVILNDFVAVQTPSAGDPPASKAFTGAGSHPPRYALLLKREGEGNLWHCLMEIMAVTLTFDVLRMARASRTGSPFLAVPDNVESTQVVILDDKPDGPYFDLWKLFSGRDPALLHDILSGSSTAREFGTTPLDIILPLPGAANPLWQNDWTDRDCRAAPLLRVFSRRVLKHYGVPLAAAGLRPGLTAGHGRAHDPQLRLTFIDRTASRRLVDRDALLHAVRVKFPEVTVDAVDFAKLSFPEQLRVARETDLLVGVHGAGMTHAMFMRENAGAVVEIQPPNLGHKGFRNLAQVRGLHYVHIEAAHPSAPRDEGRKTSGQGQGEASAVAQHDWHDQDVKVGQEAFVDRISDAITSLRSAKL